MCECCELCVGICQLISGIVLLSLAGVDFHDHLNFNATELMGNSLFNSTTSWQIDSFEPIAAGLIITASGVSGLGIILCCVHAQVIVLHMILSAAAATAAASTVWKYAFSLYDCVAADNTTLFCLNDNIGLYVSLEAAGVAATALCIFGTVMASLNTCRKV